MNTATSTRSEERPRLLSGADCHDIARRFARFVGGGYVTVYIRSTWVGNVRWARNQISTSGEVEENRVTLQCSVRGARSPWLLINQTTDAALLAAARQMTRVAQLGEEHEEVLEALTRYPLEPALRPQLFSEATYQLDADRRAEAAQHLVQAAVGHGLPSAGYIQVSAHAQAVIDSLGRARYFPFTSAQYSVTVRDPKGRGSGWAGVDQYDWSKIDASRLTQVALEKCLQSRNPVAIEPGRYTTILEPQAVCDFIGELVFDSEPLDRAIAELESSPSNGPSPFLKSAPRFGNPRTRDPGTPGFSRMGERVVDERITISADPMDPELGFPPFALQENVGDHFDFPVYHPVTWIERGVLRNLSYDRGFAIRMLGQTTGLPNSGAFRMSGGTTSVEEMIATTKRGLLVTRFDNVLQINFPGLLYRGFTRDGLWLIENGKISKPVGNMVFTESILFALNNVEQLGVPQRVFHAPVAPALYVEYFPQPVIVPPLKIRDFSFTALSQAI